LLGRVADLDAEPSVVLIRHVGADDTVHNFSPIGAISWPPPEQGTIG